MSSIAKLGMSAVALALCMQSAAADEGSPAAQVASRACGALLSRVQAVPGTEPIFLRSYDPSTGGAPTIDGAYTYDNALAVIALVACGHRDAALRRLQRGELLSVGATNTLLSLMADVTTGPRRLRGGLPADWRIAHKTGTGQDLGGSSIGINDVGLLSAPDGRTYAVAVMIPHTRQAVPERLALMQAVARAVVESWRVESGCCTSPSGPLEIAEAPPF